jgi:hypothetical protein
MVAINVAVWLALRMTSAPAPPPGRVDFTHDVRPILEQRCQPCHFAGGKMYAHLPFDQAATIDKLGTKLFTRIKRENEQRIIQAFLQSRRVD